MYLLAAKVGGGRGLSIAVLFAGGEQGFWFDPSDSATVFQDPEMTIPASNDDPVGAILDKSGNGNHLVQSASAQKPIRKTDGEFWWLDFDGADDGMYAPNTDLSSASKFTLGVVFKKDRDPADEIIVEHSDISDKEGTFAFFVASASSQAVFRYYGTGGDADGLTSGAKTAFAEGTHIFVATANTSAARAQLYSYNTGYLLSSESSIGTDGLSIDTLNVGARNVTASAALPFDGRVYGIVGTARESSSETYGLIDDLAETVGTKIYNLSYYDEEILNSGFVYNEPGSGINYGSAPNVVINQAGGSTDARIREISNVVVDPSSSAQRFKFWYTGTDTDSSAEQVHYAYSPNGLTWTKGGSVAGSAGAWLEDPYVVLLNGTYHMWCENKTTETTIRYLTSLDGSNWTDQGDINLTQCASPTVLYENKKWYMFYEDLVGTFDLHLATSNDGLTWTDYSSNPLLTRDDLDFVTLEVVPDDIKKVKGTYWMYIHGIGTDGSGIVTSQDLVAWTSATTVTRQPTSKTINNIAEFEVDGGSYLLFYDDLAGVQLGRFGGFAEGRGNSLGVTSTATDNRNYTQAFAANRTVGVNIRGVGGNDFSPGTVVRGRLNNALIYVLAKGPIDASASVSISANFSASSLGGGSFTALYAMSSGECGWVRKNDLTINS